MPSMPTSQQLASRPPRSWKRVQESRLVCPGCGCAVTVQAGDRNGWQIAHACPPVGVVEVHVRRVGVAPWAWRYSGGYGAG